MAKAVFENEWLQIEKTITDELPIYEELKTREKYDVLAFVGEKVQVRFMMLKEISENVYGLFLKIGEVKCRTKVFSGGAISDGSEVLLLFSDERDEISAHMA